MLKPNEFAVKYPGMKDLAPGESSKVALTFEVTAPGQQCHTVTVTADTGNPATDRGCVTAVARRPIAAPNPRAPIDRSLQSRAKRPGNTSARPPSSKS